MEAVVERGTATAAKIEGYTIAGKTGTAAKIVDGRYSQSDYNASFVGFVPSRKPELTIIVVIDSPKTKGYYGGVVAAPRVYAMGLPVLRRRKSTFIHGAEDDPRDIDEHLARSL